MRRSGLLSAIALIVLSFQVPVACQAAPATPAVMSTLQRIKLTGRIVLAHRKNSVPFSYLDADGRPIGYAIDLCVKVVEAVRRELKLDTLQVVYLPVDSASRITSLTDWTADIECGGTTNTSARRNQVAFSVTHFYAGGRLLVRSDSGIQSLSAMHNRTIVAPKGSTHLRFLQASSTQGRMHNRIVEVDDPGEGVAALESGRADALLFDDVVLHSLRASAKRPSDYRVVGGWTTAEPLALMMRKNDPQFKRLVDHTISRQMIDGEIRGLYRKWFQSPIPPSGITLDIEMSPLLRDQIRFPTDSVGDGPA